MVQHFFIKAESDVLKPIKDITGQSKNVDEYLGCSGSTERKIIADGFASISKRLNASITVEQWKQMCQQ
jgi:hypothetical protein